MIKYYNKEKENLPEEHKIKIDEITAIYYFKRLKSYYKFRQTLRFYGNNDSGSCGSWSIRLSHNPSIHTLAHEVAHAIQDKKNGYVRKRHKKWHTKKMISIVNRVMKHILKNKNSWDRQVNKIKLRRVIK